MGAVVGETKQYNQALLKECSVVMAMHVQLLGKLGSWKSFDTNYPLYVEKKNTLLPALTCYHILASDKCLDETRNMEERHTDWVGQGRQTDCGPIA